METVLKIAGILLVAIVLAVALPFIITYAGLLFGFLMDLDVTWLLLFVLAAIVGYLIWG